MIKNYILVTIRSLMKSKVFILINVLGMGIAIGCCIVAYYNYDFNANFDSQYPNAANVYRVNSMREFQNQVTGYGYVPVPLGEAIRQNVGDVAQVVRYSPDNGNFKIKDDIFTPGISYVDPNFFDVFRFSFLEGNPKDLSDKSKIFIDEDQAKKFFGNGPALGKTVTQVLANDKVREFTIGGVFRTQPINSSFNDKILTRYENFLDISPELQNGTHWRYRNTLFVVVPDPTRIASIERQLKPYAENNNKIREDFIIRAFKLDPLVGMGARDRAMERPGVWTFHAAPIAAVVGTAVMGILILLIACFNLTNTTIAISSRRLKEIGIRKVMGSVRIQLVLQFMTETIVVCFVALGVGMILAELFLIPAFNNLWPYMKLTTNYLGKPQFLLFLVAVLAFTGILAGSYPAFYISKFQPITILKGKLKFGGTSLFTWVLLMLQYAISLTAIVCSFAFTDNARYQRDYDLGFNRKGVVFAYVNNENEFDTYSHAISQNPNILSVAGSASHIFSSIYNDPIKHEGKEIEVDIMDVGDNYIKTAGLHLVDGRDFRKDSETDYKESIIITENLARKFGWDKPLGKEIIWMDTVKLYVIGVVKDTYAQGLWREIQPTMLRFIPKSKYTHVIVNATASTIPEVNRFMEKKWHELFPNRAYTGHYMEDLMTENVSVNTNIVKMFVFLGIVALMLSATGLFTLVSLNIIKKMKEIGIRKVFGASVGNIARIINYEFAIALLVASALGAFLGAWAARMLMGSIWKYYQPATVSAMSVSVAILVAISVLTIGYKVYSTARMNPVSTLRDE